MMTRKTEPMIAGKTYSEILSMNRLKRSRWYKTISLEEKEAAMGIVEIGRRDKISLSKMGENNPSFGGLSKKTRAKMSIGKMGENHPMYNKNQSVGAKAKISAFRIEQWKDPEYRASMTGKNAPNYIDGRTSDPQYHRRSCLRRVGLPDEFIEQALCQKKRRTDIELMMEYWLLNNRILYEFQKYIKLPSTYTKIDFFIESNICLYCDGDRYHKQEEIKVRDERITNELKLMGYRVIRIWGSDIRNGDRPLEILGLPRLKYEQQSLKSRGYCGVLKE